VSDFSISFEQPLTDRSPADAEGWARAVFEGGPVLLRWFVLLGWRGVLGLRLGPRRSRDYVAGWQVTERGPDRVVLEASSYLLASRNIAALDDTLATWTTEVDFKLAIAKPLWRLAVPIHKLSIRYLLRRAAS
jgi:hypothetical protein